MLSVVEGLGAHWVGVECLEALKIVGEKKVLLDGEDVPAMRISAVDCPIVGENHARHAAEFVR
jgi:hypothetical protein